MKHIKYYLISLTLVFVLNSSNTALGQQDPQLSLYMFNKAIFNPAFSGMEGLVSGTGAFRSQWVGFDGHPVTQTLNVHAPMRDFGVGGYIINDMAGVERSTSFMGSVAYHKDLSIGTISFGIGAGLLQQAQDGEKYRPSSTDPDPNIPIALVSSQTPDFALGVYVNDKINQRYYGGLSVTHLTSPTLDFDVTGGTTFSITFNRTLYLTGGYNLILTRDFDLQPSILIKSDFVKTQVDINANVVYKKSLVGGLTFRGATANSRDAVVVIAGINVSNNAFVAYSYDMTLSALGNYSAGSHEFVLRYLVDVYRPPAPIKVIYCPRFL